MTWKVSPAALGLVVLLIAGAVSAQSDLGGAGSDPTVTWAQTVASTCSDTSARHQEACRRWATEDLPAWARNDLANGSESYHRQLADWTRNSTEATGQWANRTAYDVKAWAAGIDEGALVAYVTALGSSLQGYAEDDVEPWLLAYYGELRTYVDEVKHEIVGEGPQPSMHPVIRYPDLGSAGLPPLPGSGLLGDVPYSEPPTPGMPPVPSGVPTPAAPPAPALPRPRVPAPEPSGPDGSSPGAVRDRLLSEVQPPRAPRSRVDTAGASPLVHGQSDARVDPAVPGAFDLPPVLSGLAVVLGGLVVVSLYRRLSKDDVLANEVRSRILERVRDDPGVGPAELADALDVATNTVIYHARVLEETGHLDVRDGSPTQYFASGVLDRRVQELVGALRRDGKGAVLRAVRDDPGIRLSELSRRVGRHRCTVKEHVDDLVETGLLGETRDGRSRRVRVPRRIRELWPDESP